ncbi:hydroxyisourate hydrolase [Chytriomyces confervae]|uniref:hydroxyisourate hydrolase n=1 Tax=Chytriomyces confervae TaxID=246404 RepID=A0A507F439_9FUNG|nr:hydroxyisourate hydrolase [Chytriomyces confervae]
MTPSKNDEEAEVFLDAVLHSADSETGTPRHPTSWLLYNPSPSITAIVLFSLSGLPPFEMVVNRGIYLELTEAQTHIDDCMLFWQPIQNPELARLIQADAPILVKHIYSIVEGMKSAKDKLAELQQRISSNSVPTSKGVSLLEIKLHGLLSYLTNLSFFILLKLHGQSTSDLHPSVERLIEMRVILEKIKPMEVKLKYQIDKVLKAANDASNPSADKDAQRNVSEFDLQNSGVSDPLQFKPNPLNLVGASSALDKNADQSGEDGGVYRPPRIAPVKYSEEPKRRRGDLSASTRESLSKSRLFKDMRDTFDTSRPEQVTSHGTGYGVRELRDSKDEELAKIEEFELSNYQRLSATRDRNKREKAAMRKGGAAGIVDEMENLESDFLQMDALDRAVSFDNQERYGSSGSVLAKRNMRAESFFTGNDEPRKKGKFTDATELVTKVASGAAGKKTAQNTSVLEVLIDLLIQGLPKKFMASMLVTISTHVLNTATGMPVADLKVSFSQQMQPDQWVPVTECATNMDGRVASAFSVTVERGSKATLRLRFDTAKHSVFYPLVDVVFVVDGDSDKTHYHVPLLLAPYGYSTYRGS